MSFKTGAVKLSAGFGSSDVTTKTLRTEDICTDTLDVKESAIINCLEVGSFNVSELELNGTFQSTELSRVDLNGKIALNNQISVLTLEQFILALAEADATPGTSIRVGPGLFVIPATLIIPRDTDIIGSGENSTIFQAKDGLTGGTTGATNFNPIFRVIGDNVSISSLRIDANGQNQNPNSVGGNITAAGIDSLLIFDVQFVNNNATSTSFVRAHVLYQLACSNCAIINCKFGPEVRNARTFGIVYDVFGTTDDMVNMQIANCRFVNPSGIPVGTENTLSTVSNFGNLRNWSMTNTISDVVAEGVVGTIATNVRDSRLISNIFSGFVVFFTNSSGVQIIANQFKNSLGLILQGSSGSCENFIISDNLFDGQVTRFSDGSLNTFLEVIRVNPASTDIRNIQICGNVINNPPNGAIRIVSPTSSNVCQNIIVTDNIISRNNTVDLNIDAPLDFEINPLLEMQSRRNIGRNLSITERTLAPITGGVDSNGTVIITGNTANTATSFLTELQIGDQIVINATSANVASIVNNEFLTTTVAIPSNPDNGITVTTYNEINGYDDLYELSTSDGSGSHSLTLQNIHPASQGRQITIHMLSHGGTASDDVTITPDRTGVILPTLTTSYTSATLDTDNVYVTFEWSGDFWDIRANNGAIII